MTDDIVVLTLVELAHRMRTKSSCVSGFVRDAIPSVQAIVRCGAPRRLPSIG